MQDSVIIVFGNIGSDAGYWYLGADGKIHRVPGWNPDTRAAFAAIEKNLAILQKAGLRETSGIREAGNLGAKIADKKQMGMQ